MVKCDHRQARHRSKARTTYIARSSVFNAPLENLFQSWRRPGPFCHHFQIIEFSQPIGPECYGTSLRGPPGILEYEYTFSFKHISVGNLCRGENFCLAFNQNLASHIKVTSFWLILVFLLDMLFDNGIVMN